MSVAFGISLIAVVVALLMAWLLHARGGVPAALAFGGVGIAMAVELAVARSGLLAEWQRRPPPFMVMMAILLVVTLALAMRGPGARVAARASFAALIGIQAFRLPLELVMHQAASDGVMPIQMSYSGWNFDILTGTFAVPVALLAATGRAPRWLVGAWNVMGVLWLANVVTIAIVSTPLVAAFGSDRLNTWVADPPYVWLPGVLVPAALFGHVVIFRKLAAATSMSST